jgi:hypothetical protein
LTREFTEVTKIPIPVYPNPNHSSAKKGIFENRCINLKKKTGKSWRNSPRVQGKY